MKKRIGCLVFLLILVSVMFAGVSASENVQAINDVIKQKIDRLFDPIFNPDSRIEMLLPNQYAEIPKETSWGIAYGIDNKLDSDTFSYSIGVGVDNSTLEERCGISPAFADSFIATGKSGTVQIAGGDRFYNLVRFYFPENAPNCIIRYKIDILKNGQPYVTEIFDIGVVDSHRYILKEDFGDIIYDSDSLEEGIDADGVDVLAYYFNGFEDGASARYRSNLLDNPSMMWGAIVGEFDHDITYSEFSEFVENNYEGQPGISLDYDPVDEDLGIAGAQVLFIGTPYEQENAMWASGNKIISIVQINTGPVNSSLREDYIRMLTRYLKKHKSTLVIESTPILNRQIVVGDDSPPIDWSQALELNHKYGGDIFKDSERSISDLNGMITTVIYQGKAIVIIDKNGAPQDFANAMDINNYLENTMGLESKGLIKNSEVTSDKLIELLTESQISCTDTDGGVDYYNYGYATYNGNNYEDWCSINHGDGGMVGECSGSDCELIEIFCDKDAGGVNHDYYSCPNGCANGACKKQVNNIIEFEKGWNLVSVFSLGEAPFEGEEGYLNNKGIRAIFLYDKHNGHYIRLHPNIEQQKLDLFVDSIEEDNGYAAAFVHSSMWVYSNKDQKIEFDYFNPVDEGLDLSAVKLETGWNFLAVVPEMIGKGLNQWKGNCEIPVAAFWDGDEWEVGQGNDFDQPFPSEVLGYGLIVKVQADCMMGEQNTPVPPLPDFPDYCQDSDGGNNMYKKGQVTGPVGSGDGSNGWDHCYNGEGTPMSYQGRYLLEYYCSDSTSVNQEVYDCPNGCKDGACVQSESSCMDSDGGDDFYTRGYRLAPNHGSGEKEEDYCILDPFIYSSGSVVSNYDKKVDECYGDKCYVIEYHCKADLADAHRGFKCPNGCKDGACIRSEDSCIDSDGGRNLYVKGRTNWSNYEYKDYCTTNVSVNEYYCQDGKLEFKNEPCENGCSDGACINSGSGGGGGGGAVANCTDSDGGKDIYTKGLLVSTVQNYTGYDYCYHAAGGEYMVELFCEDGKGAAEAFPCSKGCSDGACLR